jgi:hypothetical protein
LVHRGERHRRENRKSRDEAIKLGHFHLPSGPTVDPMR